MLVEEAIGVVQRFRAGSQTNQIHSLQKVVAGEGRSRIADITTQIGVDELLSAALDVKRASAQIDVVIHAAGILHSLPYLLAEGEVVESVSLGADNSTGDYDLVTNRRVAEFKFITWQPKGNALREKTLFEDFVKLSFDHSDRKKYLYLLSTELPLKFLQSGRTVEKVLDRNARLKERYVNIYAESYTYVREFYAAFRSTIQIVDLRSCVPGFEPFVELLKES